MAQNFVKKITQIGSGNLTDYDKWPFVMQGRLTLESGVPVSTSDITGASADTVYLTPYKGDRIALYDTGTAMWKHFQFTEKSVAVPSTTVTPFDVFAYISGSTIAIECLDWTNDTTRATALTTQDGVYVKNGDVTRRYLGTGRTTGVSGQSEKSTSSDFLWNYYNRVKSGLFAKESTSSWTYTSTTLRPSNNVTTLGVTRVNLVIGVEEDSIEVQVKGLASNTSSVGFTAGIGLDSTSVNSSQLLGAVSREGFVAYVDIPGNYSGYLGSGFHFIQWLEASGPLGTTSWAGDLGSPSIFQTGLVVTLFS